MKSWRPLVSICIPAYNAGKYIAEALDSVLGQTYSRIEVIVVNDGSSDETEAVLETYAKADIRLKVFHRPNKGAAASRNYAFNQSKGELIKFFDADDIMSQSMVEQQVKVLHESQQYIASAEWGRFYNDDINTFQANPEEVWKDMKSVDWIIESLKEGGNMMQPGIFLIPRKIIEKIGGWNEQLSLIDDFEFMIRVLLAAERIRFTPDACLHYRSGITQSLSTQKSRGAMESAYRSTQLGCRYILEKESSERAQKVCANIWQQRVYEFYPACKDLANKAERHVANLGKPSIALPAGPGLKLLAKCIGWKLAKTLHYFYYQRGFNPIFK